MSLEQSSAGGAWGEGGPGQWGRLPHAWEYKPPAAPKRRAFLLLGLAGGIWLANFCLTRSRWTWRVLAPLLEPLLYAFVGLAGKQVYEAFRAVPYEVYEDGARILSADDREHGKEQAKVTAWSRIRDCSLRAEGVGLFPNSRFGLPVTLSVNGSERWMVYDLSRGCVLRARLDPERRAGIRPV